ncbi:copper resistance protein [Roseomonas sp. NAR14]|uniref:Copper resistance protein n=1 Tax=Roseomonas acroporae TaxID=2937791 RepID=A0A9X1YAB3_9PROT|nr:CopD family protein [Roseomonas acroporae]MCK8786438.1 copper resistance protein [Roseomonas acroporae]
MQQFLDVYGFVSVLLHMAVLLSRSALIGGIAFWVLLAVPVSRDLTREDGARLLGIARRGVRIAAWLTLGLTALASVLGALALAASMEIPLGSALGAEFVVSGAIVVAGAALALLLAAPADPPAPGRRLALAAAALLCLAGGVAGSHAMARTEDRALLMLATALHHLGAALWLGGLPVFLASLRLAGPVRRRAAVPAGLSVAGPASLGAAQVAAPAMSGLSAARAIGAAYSRLAAGGVLLIVLGILGFWGAYLGGVGNLYGTAYGAMSATKGALFGLLLLLGLGNFLVLHGFVRNPEKHLNHVRRFVECEIGLGVAVLAAAASLTSLPPAVDNPAADVASWAEVTERFTPTWPRLSSPDHADLAIPELQARLDAEWQRRQADPRPQAFAPGEGFLPPRNASDIAWSEYNHHWAGLVVLLVGLAALLDATGRVPWARHWPLLFLILAGFLAFRSDPEVWPLGEIGLIESMRDAEVVQHRLFALLVVAFAVAEWRVRLGKVQGRLRYVFPGAMVLGGVLLLAHNHAISNVKEALLIELSHLPLGAMAVISGCARWVELRGEGREARIARWVWPVGMVLMGLLLMLYREA